MEMAENAAQPRMQPPKSFTTKDTKSTKKTSWNFSSTFVASVFFVLFVVDFSYPA